MYMNTVMYIFQMSLNFTGNIIQVKTRGAAVCPALCWVYIFKRHNLNDLVKNGRKALVT